MDYSALHTLLESLQKSHITVEQAMQRLRGLPFEDLGFAKVDHHRALRKGFGEVIFCQNKTPGHIVSIVKDQIARDETILGTRASPEAMEAVEREIPGVEINALSRCFWKKSSTWRPRQKVRGTIVIATGGTADLPVAEEARVTIELMGHPCKALYDVGVAGIHRLFAYREDIEKAAVIVAVAGMEGALPSVITGMVSCPVIGVPTSVGYGSHLGGMVPLFAMLNSCATGMTVVNIDNGFGAGYAAGAINQLEI